LDPKTEESFAGAAWSNTTKLAGEDWGRGRTIGGGKKVAGGEIKFSRMLIRIKGKSYEKQKKVEILFTPRKGEVRSELGPFLPGNVWDSRETNWEGKTGQEKSRKEI